jgi:hypothetical protein
MANVNFCIVCGSEVLTGVDAGEAFAIGYCECIAVPEVDVFVLEDTDMPCCVPDNKIFIFCSDCGHEGSDPCGCSLPVFCVVCDTCTCDGKCDDDGRVEIEDEEFVYVYEEAEVLAASVGCLSCGQAACSGPNENGYCLEYYDRENEAALRKFQGLDVDGPEPVAVAVAPLWVEAAMVLMMIVSFFGILYDIATGRNNDPKLVVAWYAFCAYLIVSYSAVIIWFLC